MDRKRRHPRPIKDSLVLHPIHNEITPEAIVIEAQFFGEHTEDEDTIPGICVKCLKLIREHTKEQLIKCEGKVS